MTKTIEQREVKEQGYDETPYTGYPFEYNRPENLKSVATLFGMNPAPLETARVLELGCSDGNNLFRFAETYPKSFTLGVDLSKVEIEHGQTTLKDLKLKNVELKAMSLTDLDESYGKFDYIICHGVFSWVPDFVRDSILEVSKKLLSKNGLTFISYNTLPGWNMINTVRELMMYHSGNFTDVRDRIQQARASLNFLQESLAGHKTPHAEFMEASAKQMAEREDHYLRHEYLADENQAFYFNEFMAMAQEKGLAYLGDTDVQRMYIGNLPQKAIEKLGTITDIVRTEQYMDFIKNTQFRCTVLTHKDTPISRNITNECLDKFNYYCNINPKEQDINIADNSTATFYIDNIQEKTMASSDPAMKAVLMTLHKNLGNCLSIKELAAEAKKLVTTTTEESILQNIYSNFSTLIFRGYIKFIADKPKSIATISKKPKISELARLQAQKIHANNKFWLTTNLNQLMLVQSHQLTIVQALDGTNTVDQIKADTLESLINGKLNAANGDKKIEDKKQLETVANALVDNTLEDFRKNFIFIA
ncbi:MAG: methyltransferase regulatory domain-containing protein [Rickettsiaceae bacterium]|nr:methyltransferase regulatory domain-containing protein [Rickettsiaceae bacterium]MDP4832956.1 methyltransferase regulatory domain-containing protein [Rickettsiaceae bacterium]MDP5020901.1 methyltransferase regulatory domain-containing protein [Rickettsiaceae bacterium]MDP5083518.1 methyltransferase regulatory domain-containing protein [Rickettsiaceae bacterium]